MKTEKLENIEDGGSFEVEKDPGLFFLGCCDCNLTHIVIIQNKRSTVKFTFYRDERRTGQRRRRQREKEIDARNKN